MNLDCSMPDRVTRTLGALVVLAATVLSLPGCGYALAGRGNTLPPHIKIIGVPGLANQSTTPGIDEHVNRAIREEMSGRGGIRVQPDENGVDAVLTGAILAVTLEPSVISQARLVTEVRLIVIANVEFRDKKDDKVLWSNPRVRTQETYPIAEGADASDPGALFRNDTNAIVRLAKAFARSIVTQIFESF